MKCLPILCLILVAGCKPPKQDVGFIPDADHKQLLRLQLQVTALQSNLNRVQAQCTNYADANVAALLITSNDVAISMINSRVSLLESAGVGRLVCLNPESTSFSVMDTALGKLFLSTEKVEPYLDGYKVFISVGNPNYTKIDGFDLVWFIAQAGKTYYAHTNKIATPLPAGAWTQIDFVASPAQSIDMHNLWLRVDDDLSKISLYTPDSGSKAK